MPISEAVFQKHVYGRQRKHELKPIEEFDPRPVELRGKTIEHLKTLLGKVRGQGSRARFEGKVLAFLFFSMRSAGAGQVQWNSHSLRCCLQRKNCEREWKNFKKVCACLLISCRKLSSQLESKAEVLCGTVFSDIGSRHHTSEAFFKGSQLPLLNRWCYRY